MKKTTKIILFISISLIIVGIGLTVIGLANGGSQIFYWDTEHNKLVDEDSLIITESEKVKVEAFESINIEADVDIYFIPSDDYYLEYMWKALDKGEVEIKNGELTIKSNSQHRIQFGIFDDNENEGYLNIYYPSDVVFEHVNIQQDMGDGDISDINAKSLELEIDMGDYVFSNIDVDFFNATLNMGSFEICNSNVGKFTIECNMGDLTVENCEIDTLDASLSMGTFEGDKISIRKSGNIECDMGDIDLILNGSNKMYSITTDVDMGDVDIEGGKGGNGDIMLNLDCNMGDIEINFTE